MTSSDQLPTPASAPWTGTVGGAVPSCVDLAAGYLRLWEAIRASAACGDADEENRLRNRAQVALGRLRARRCPVPPGL